MMDRDQFANLELLSELKSTIFPVIANVIVTPRFKVFACVVGVML